MSKSIDQMFSCAEYLFDLSQNDLSLLRHKDIKQTNCQNKSIDERLLDLIIEEKSKTNQKIKNLSNGSFAVKKLVAKEKLNHLIINLLSGSEGYTIGVKINELETSMDSMCLSYEDNQLLDYIDCEELPPFLVDFIENSALINCNLFQSGCLIVEVRDFRRSAPTHSHHYSSNWVLLRPTTQSLTNDVMNIINTTSNEYLWTNEDKAELESQLILATSPNICLDPSPAVAILSNKLWRKKKMFKNSTFLKLSKRCSQLSANRVKKLEALAAPKSFRLQEFLKKRNNKNNSQSKVNKAVNFNIIEPNLESIPINSIGVKKLAKELPKPLITADNSLIKVEEYTMDFMDDNRRSLTNVTILHRPIDDTYFGQLYIDKLGHIRGSTSTFCLGTKQSTKRYVEQFTEILTENGRKSVKIIHQMSGQLPQVSYTPAATAQGLPTGATKESHEEEAISLGSSPTKKCKVEQNSPISATTLLQSPIISPTSSATCVTPKPIETITIPTAQTVFSPPKVMTDSITSPILTSGVHTTTCSTTISESALAVILTPSSGITKSIQQIDCSDTSHQTIATSTPLPTGVSLASLSLAPVQQNLRLHNLVSLTPQGLAVPISLTMMSTPAGTQSSIMTTPGSMIVSLDQTQNKDDDNVTVTYATTPATVIMSTGNGGSNVLSVPIGMAGSLGVHQLNAQFITNQLKQNSGQIRGTTPQVSLLQMSNAPNVPILRPLAPHTYAPTSSTTTFSQIQSSPNSNSIMTGLTGLTPQQQLVNALRNAKQVQTQQQIQISPQKSPRKRQNKK